MYLYLFIFSIFTIFSHLGLIYTIIRDLNVTIFGLILEYVADQQNLT